jgi:uncharacterized protein YigA (DUF484 family)
MDQPTHDHYIALVDRWQRDADSHKAKLFDAWKSLRMQQKGLNRLARKIKRLNAQLAELKPVAARARQAEHELAQVDAVLAHRTALDDAPTRVEKIMRAILAAKKANP